MNNSYIYIYHVNVTQTVPDISPLMPMHQDPLLVSFVYKYAAVRPSTSNEKHRLEGYRRFGDDDVDTMGGNYLGIPRTSVFVVKTTEGSLLQVPCL